MALTATSMRRDGSQDQTKSLAFTSIRGADENLAEFQHQISVKAIAAKMLNERIRKLVAEAAAKDKRLAELEDGLRLTREDLAHRDHESNSLQTSLDLVTTENARLSVRLDERAVDAEVLSARLENSRTALLAAEAERDRLAIALHEGNDLHRIESDELNNRLDAMTSRTAAMESLLADVRKSLLARIEESDAAARKAIDATLALDAADEALGQLHGSLQVKEHQVRALEQSRAVLIAGAGTLLEAFEARVAALAAAEDKAKSLAGRVAEAEAKSVLAQSRIESLNLKLQNGQAALVEAGEAIKALIKRIAEAEANSSAARSEIESLNFRLQNGQGALAEAGEAIKTLVKRIAEAEANSSAAQSEIERLNLKLQNEQASRIVAEAALSKAHADHSRLQGELDNISRRDIAKRDETRPKPASMPKQASGRSATSLLAATISF
jgi:chromosome segregation ATPase